MNKFKRLFAKTKETFDVLKRKSFFSIFISQVIYKIAAFCSSMFVVRILTKSDYGLYSYANNIIALFLLIDGLGTASGILQFGSEHSSSVQKKSSYKKYGLKIGLLCNVVITLALIIYSLVGRFSFDNAAQIIILMTLQPIFSYLINYINVILRIDFKNKRYSIFSIILGVSICCANIFGAMIGKVIGMIVGQYIVWSIALVVSLFLAKEQLVSIPKAERLSKPEKKAFIKISLFATINSAITQLLVVFDVFLLGLILVDELILADYKVASAIPLAIAFLPACIMIFSYPYFARNNKDLKWIISQTKKIIFYSVVICSSLTIVLILCAPQLLGLIFGEQYKTSTNIFRIMMISFVFSGSINVPISNILISMKCVWQNLIIGIIQGLVKIGLNVLFILRLGSIGAAYVTLIVTVLTSILLIIVFLYCIKKRKTDEKIENAK